MNALENEAQRPHSATGRYFRDLYGQSDGDKPWNLLAENPDEWQGHYNAACLEALMKNRDATLEHLRRAIELDPQAKEFAAKDTDFDWLRDDSEFPA